MSFVVAATVGDGVVIGGGVGLVTTWCACSPSPVPQSPPTAGSTSAGAPPAATGGGFG